LRWAGFVAAAALCACGSGSPPPRGFGSHLLVPTRDGTLTFTSVGNGVATYDTGPDGGVASWRLDLATGQLQPKGSPDAGTEAGVTGTGFRCDNSGFDAQSNTVTITVTNRQTGEQSTVDGVTQIWVCPTDANPILTVLRSDASGTQTLWSGPPDQLQLVPLAVTIARPVVFSGKSVAVFAGTQPDALGIFSIDLTTFAVTELVPATLGTAVWADGATGTGALASTRLLLPPASGPNATVPLLHGHFIYERAMTDGSTIVFAGPISSGPASEVALFEIVPSGTLLVFPQLYTSTNANVQLTAFQYLVDAATDVPTLFVWDDGRAQLFGCVLPEEIDTVGLTSADGTQLLLGAKPAFGIDDAGKAVATLVLASLPSAPVASPGCTVLGFENVNYAGFSLTGDDVFWMTDETTLWTASGDGRDARPIGKDAIYSIQDPHFAVGTELEMLLHGDLVWVDTSDPYNTAHDIAVRAFGDVYDFGATTRNAEGPWLISGYDLSGQDGTGSLAVFNRDAPAKTQPISPEVVSYKVGRAGPTPDGGLPTLDVVYLVRGRNPSSQDGVWAATIDEATLGN
jgi:hypothetical protein